MKQTPAYEEKSEGFHLALPVRIHRMSFGPGASNVFYLHWHREFEFFLLTKGAAVFTVEDREYRVQAGQGVFINANHLHSARGVRGSPCEFLAVVFHSSLLFDSSQEEFSNKYLAAIEEEKLCFDELLTADSAWQSRVLELLEKIRSIPVPELRNRELLIKSYLLEIWHWCYQNAFRPEKFSRPGLSSGRLRPVVEHIHGSYMFDLPLEKLAELLPLSVGQFCRVFKQETGLTPVAYITRYRIMQSCRLLSETDRPVTDVASMTGFNNISYFNKVFLSKVGCTPTEYRREESKGL